MGQVTGTTWGPLVRGVTRSYIWVMSLLNSLRPGGRHGLSSREVRDPIGLAVAVVNRLAQSDLIDRVGLRKQSEQVVYSTTRNGFRVATAAGRTFARAGATARRGTVTREQRHGLIVPARSRVARRSGAGPVDPARFAGRCRSIRT